jgi:hypothetical protein
MGWRGRGVPARYKVGPFGLRGMREPPWPFSHAGDRVKGGPPTHPPHLPSLSLLPGLASKHCLTLPHTPPRSTIRSSVRAPARAFTRPPLAYASSYSASVPRFAASIDPANSIDRRSGRSE